VPEDGVALSEDLPGIPVPPPREVQREVRQSLEVLREVGNLVGVGCHDRLERRVERLLSDGVTTNVAKPKQAALALRLTEGVTIQSPQNPV
jgi:hypothetical protein